MKLLQIMLVVVGCLAIGNVMAGSSAVTTMLQEYTAQGGSRPDANKGKEFWFKKFPGTGKFSERACVSCHTDDLKNTGKHVKTRKKIDPMAPSVNPDRLTSTREIRKWFKRNCKWTIGRECTASEKANLLAFIQQQ